MVIWKPNNNKWRHNDVITKCIGKIGTSAKPNKIYIIRKVLKSYPKMCFLLNLSYCVKSYGHFVKWWLFLQFRSPKYNIRKSHKISSGKAPYFRSYQQGGWWKTPIRSVFRVNTILIVQVQSLCRLVTDYLLITFISLAPILICYCYSNFITLLLLCTTRVY